MARIGINARWGLGGLWRKWVKLMRERILIPMSSHEVLLTLRFAEARAMIKAYTTASG